MNIQLRIEEITSPISGAAIANDIIDVEGFDKILLLLMAVIEPNRRNSMQMIEESTNGDQCK